MKAKIERYKRTRVGDIITRERAKLPCGCCMLVGLSADRQPATRAAPCAEKHLMVMERANQLLVESLATPSKVQLVVVCAQFLTQASREFDL